MFKFVIILFGSFLLSCVNGRPDISWGYQNNQGHSSSGDGSFLQAPPSITLEYSPTAPANSYFASEPSVGQISSSENLPSAKQVSYEDLSHQTSNCETYTGDFNFNTGSDSFFQTPADVAPIVTKHFYIHTAPSNDDDQEVIRHIQIGQPQKNYHVVFIDNPSSQLKKAKIVADIAPVEEKTAIYVLSKKNSAFHIDTEVNTPAPPNNKPDVFFIKYNTPEEANQAKQAIQEQYDSLGGQSIISRETPISVSQIINNLADATHTNSDASVSASSSDGSSTAFKNVQQTYLPADT